MKGEALVMNGDKPVEEDSDEEEDEGEGPVVNDPLAADIDW